MFEDSDRTGPRLLAHASSLLPVLSVAAVCLSIIYNVVFLFFAGGLDFVTLTIADVLSKAWTVLPISLLFIALTVVSFLFGRHAGTKNPPAFSGFGADDFPGIRALMFGCGLFLITVSPALVGFARIVLKDDDTAVLKILVSVHFAFSSGLMLMIFSDVWRRHRVVVMLLVPYVATIFLCGLAAQSGLHALMSSEPALVRYGQNHLFCGRVINVAERGILAFDPTFRVKKFIPSSEVKSLERPGGCAWAKRPQAPKTAKKLRQSAPAHKGSPEG